MGFITPEFLDKLDVEALHRSMLAQLPEDIDASEGGPVWDLTRPTAYMTAEMAQYILPWFLSQIWAQSATGPYLDMHAQRRALARKEAVSAQGVLVLTGQPGTCVPAGSLFSTTGKNGAAPIEFHTTQDVELIGEPVEVPIEAALPGKSGNVAANTILLLPTGGNLTGIASVTNPSPTFGGYDQEDDEGLRERILEYDRSPGSYIGNTADYKRWAMSVTGVGGATVVSPEDDSGTVRIILVDANGLPAPEQLCQAVYAYIIEGDNPAQQRFAPVNAKLEVRPSETLPLAVSAIIELEPGAALDAAKADFSARMSAYFDTAREEDEIRFTQVAALLSSSAGVHDFKGLTVNGGQANIPLPEDHTPILSPESLALTEGVV